jgi:hypothetical protein
MTKAQQALLAAYESANQEEKELLELLVTCQLSDHAEDSESALSDSHHLGQPPPE